MNYIASYRMRHESCCARLYIMQVRSGCAFVLEWNLPFRNPGSATVVGKLLLNIEYNKMKKLFETQF